MGNRSHGLDIAFEHGMDNKKELHWEHYEVKQLLGVSEWLIAVSQDGAIMDAQAMICAPDPDSVSRCPSP